MKITSPIAMALPSPSAFGYPNRTERTSPLSSDKTSGLYRHRVQFTTALTSFPRESSNASAHHQQTTTSLSAITNTTDIETNTNKQHTMINSTASPSPPSDRTAHSVNPTALQEHLPLPSTFKTKPKFIETTDDSIMPGTSSPSSDNLNLDQPSPTSPNHKKRLGDTSSDVQDSINASNPARSALSSGPRLKTSTLADASFTTPTPTDARLKASLATPTATTSTAQAPAPSTATASAAIHDSMVVDDVAGVNSVMSTSMRVDSTAGVDYDVATTSPPSSPLQVDPLTGFPFHGSSLS